MRQIMTDELKQIELAILKNVADFCDNHNLKYFLAYGTLIGAIRHKGFIPWDDDVDIWMPRDDYNKFINIYNDENDTYKVISPSDKKSRHTFAKVEDTRTVKLENSIDYSNGCLGIDIDIFPLDGQPFDDEDFSRWYNKLIREYKKFSYLILEGKCGSFKRRIFLPLIKILVGKKEKILNKTTALHKKYPYATSEYVGTVESLYNFKSNRYKKEWFSDSVDVKFEDISFKAPIGYDDVLTAMYGDYMTLPPPGKRITHHSNNVFWLEG